MSKYRTVRVMTYNGIVVREYANKAQYKRDIELVFKNMGYRIEDYGDTCVIISPELAGIMKDM